MPATIAEWEPNSSSKMNALVRILQYHMATPNAPPLHVDDSAEAQGRNKLVPNPNIAWNDTPDVNTPDKILVYSAFPFHNDPFIKPVPLQIFYTGCACTHIDERPQILELYDIHPLELNGMMTIKQRVQSVQKFTQSAKSEVMIISNVAQVGLNLQVANILVILVRLIFIIPRL